MAVSFTSPKVETSTEIRKCHTIKIGPELILQWLRQTHKIPDDVHVEFMVPGGGDWSNTPIDIDSNNLVRVYWETTEHEDSRS